MACSFQPDALAKYFVLKGADGKKVTAGGTKFSHFTNPVQSSSLKNCHLIAALSSIAWVNKTFFPDKGNVNVYNFNFFDNGSIPVSVTSNLFSDGTTPCGAKSNNWDTADHESWPPLWEKAFAKFCMYKILGNYSLADLQNAAKDPVYSLLPNGSNWGGNPVTVMKYLTGSNPLFFSPMAGSYSFKGIQYSGYYDFIKNAISEGTSIPAKNGAMTKYPAGAWTYVNATAAQQKNGGVPISYSNATLVADHCYSVLGVYENSTSKYIVLRNPYGGSDPSQVSLGSGTWSYNKKVYQPWGTQKAGTVITQESRNLSDPDGIFALEQSVFSNYFEQFGFIY